MALAQGKTAMGLMAANLADTDRDVNSDSFCM
ncbi:MAG: hypothetical protein ACI9VS_001264 [Candidatus Binatia bacterium]|jgi:hypothetical protein